MEFYEELSKVKSKTNFTEFINLLINDYKNNKQEWENQTIEEYLDGIKSWIEDMEFYYKNTNQEMPDNINWQFLANILYCGKIYE